MEVRKRIQMIPVDQIHVLNPRNRDKRKFAEIVASIAKLGLKKPIAVSLRRELEGDAEYDLVYGQGRLEGFIFLGQTKIPAIVSDFPRETRLLISLTENFARRTPRMFEMVRQIGIMRDTGYKNCDISRLIGVDESIVSSMLHLLDNGEERLLQAVETDHIPITVAMQIAKASGDQAQAALSKAYEKGLLRGKALDVARRLIERRNTYGKAFRGNTRKDVPPVTTGSIMRVFEEESKRQQSSIAHARLCEARLGFVTNALRTLLADENFSNLLRAEKLDTIPAYLAERIQEESVS